MKVSEHRSFNITRVFGSNVEFYNGAMYDAINSVVCLFTSDCVPRGRRSSSDIKADEASSRLLLYRCSFCDRVSS